MGIVGRRLRRGADAVLVVYVGTDHVEVTHQSVTLDEPVTAEVPTSVWVGDDGLYTGAIRVADDEFIRDPVRALGRSLVTVRGKDTDPAELLVPVVRDAAEAAGCDAPEKLGTTILVYPENWGDRAVAALRRVGELWGTDPSRIVLVPAESPRTADILAEWTMDRDQVASRRTKKAVVIGAVLAATALVGGILVVSGRDTSETDHVVADGQAPDADVERLAAFLDDDGGLDCRQLYSSMSLATLRSAGLRPSVPIENNVDRGTVTDDGQTVCTIAYVGEKLHGKAGSESLERLTGLGFEGAAVMNPAFARVVTAKESTKPSTSTVNRTDDYEYRGWSFRTWESGYTDGRSGSVILRGAVTEIPGRGRIALQFATGPDGSYGAETDLVTEPDAAVKNIIDGLEDVNLPKIVQPAPSLMDARGHYDCSLFYETATADYVSEKDLWVPGPKDRTVFMDGERGLVPAGRDDGAGRKVCWMMTDKYALNQGGYVVQVTTGPSDGQAGNPVTGDDSLGDWREYWNFAPVLAPRAADNAGDQSYNVKTCHSEDDCLTISVFYWDPQRQTGPAGVGDFMENPVRPMALDVARILDDLDTSPEQ